jgi:hypothetical protein
MKLVSAVVAVIAVMFAQSSNAGSYEAVQAGINRCRLSGKLAGATFGEKSLGTSKEEIFKLAGIEPDKRDLHNEIGKAMVDLGYDEATSKEKAVSIGFARCMDMLPKF